ncbi:hypothetical protein [Actinoplanes awajinensis]|uniref:ESX-1 secretion-associated protein n=1 Tax=Actinoplanes awajinensis subsp. mycoplanecinus TaxID=135947 RepID=A0A101JLG3_9ACTN|nr:hypothetical protein [Actinoplanes awajinensis]KUL28848.1 hypothetical protein ADL15_30580 [Actinoplanes awajinensis subsp. mycoplanecinus]
MGFEVAPDGLDEVANALRADGQALQALVATLQGGAVTSDAYGQIGTLVGLNDGYQQHLQEAIQEISEGAALLDRAAALLTANAESYRSTDIQHAEQFGKIL